MIKFKCSLKKGKQHLKWYATILDITNHQNHIEIMIISQSTASIRLLIGKTLTGHFACFPDLKIGCHLSDYTDVFENTKYLKCVLSMVESITVAYAIRKVAEFYAHLTDGNDY